MRALIGMKNFFFKDHNIKLWIGIFQNSGVILEFVL